MVSHLRSHHPDIDRLLDHARAQGFRVEVLASTHLRVTPPNRGSPLVTISGSPSDWRAVYAVKRDLKRAGVAFPEAPKRRTKSKQSKNHKEKHAMPRTTKTTTTTATTTRATRATTPRPAPTKPAAPSAPATPIAPLVSAADEARALRAQASAVSTIDREVRNPANMLEPMKLDADIAHLGGDVTRPKAKLPRRREPDEVAVVYRGKYKGMLHDAHIQITVPDDENEAKVAALEEIIPGMDPQSQKAEWTQKAKMQGLEVAPPYVPLHKRLTLTGITYDFARDEATLVHEDDLEYVLAHPTYRLERVDTLDDADEPLPANSRRSRRLAQAQAGHGPLKRGS